MFLRRISKYESNVIEGLIDYKLKGEGLGHKITFHTYVDPKKEIK